jgi:hypothetical protein
VRQPDGTTAYTRAGQLQVDANGILVNASGLPLIPQITVPANATALTIGEDGMVSAKIAGNVTPQQLGQLTLTSFINPTGLLALGENLFAETPSSGTPTEGTPGTALGQAQAGHAGRLERAGGGRNGRHDRCPAHLRDEHQGAVGRRQYAAVPVAGSTLMKAALPALLLALLAGCAALQPPAVRPGPSDEPPAVARSSGPRGVSGGVFSADLGCR